jgi:aminopeptidase N
VTKKIDDVELTMLHREPDKEKVKRNEDEIFRLHKASLDYMEEYTGIKQPFKKFGFALIPSFQFGGMEHVGAIQYQANTLMLEKNPSPNELLGRAALIGHETAHMWFGDLVTMDWFNDVWTKEVFANFFAAKLVNPSFPEIDHQLRSHLRLHPSAYAVDRTEGPNPIRQELPNLNEAGTLYGGIIYNKAPIMMQQLEILLGEEKFREGIREYLNAFAFDNATWTDLIAILDKRTDVDLNNWSEVWVNTPGRPTFTVNNNAELDQIYPANQSRKWPQKFAFKKGAAPYEISFMTDTIALDQFGNSANDNLLFNSDGLGYGLFPIEKNYIRYNWDTLSPLERAAGFVSLYEQLLEGNGTITPNEYLNLIIWAMEREDNPLIINHLLRQMVSIFWSLLNQEQRLEIVASLENALWVQVTNPSVDTGNKRAFFRSYANIALTEDGISNTRKVWDNSLEIDNLNLATRDYTNLAAILAIKIPDQAERIVEAQTPRVNGLDNQRRFEFIKYSLSDRQKTRDDFFDALLSERNRHTEAWVLSGLNYLHHPLRAEQSEKYIQDSLEILQEIQMTGDIFFPGRWLSATLRYYQSDSAVETVRNFLNDRPDYNKQLKMKILQEADDLFRANKILKQTTSASN